jgi:hypothetical protein
LRRGRKPLLACLALLAAGPAAAGRVSTPAAAPDAPPVPRLGAPVEVGAFRFARGIGEEPPGLASLALDAAVLAHCAATLGDLRIVDGSGRQVPYVLERRDEPLSLPLGELAKTATKGGTPEVSRYTLRLPYATLPASRLLLVTRARVFERDVRLLRPAGAGRDAEEERVLAALTWRHADPDNPAPPLALELPANAGDRFEIAIDEGDNAPLPLDAPRLLLPSYRLRYFPPAEGGAHLELLYGRPDLGPPRYDLALFTARMLGDSAREVTLLPEPKPGTVRDAAAVPRTVFWVALAGAVVVLLILLARLLRAPASPSSTSPS